MTRKVIKLGSQNQGYLEGTLTMMLQDARLVIVILAYLVVIRITMLREQRPVPAIRVSSEAMIITIALEVAILPHVSMVPTIAPKFGLCGDLGMISLQRICGGECLSVAIIP